jgi:hypothetical protein
MCIVYATVCTTIGMKHVPYGIKMPVQFVLACKLSDTTADDNTDGVDDRLYNTVMWDAYNGGLHQLAEVMQLIQLVALTHILVCTLM